MNWKGILIFISLIILGIYLIGFGSSAPPSQTNINVDIGIEIKYVLIETQPTNTDLTISAHIFNISDGLKITNETATCEVHLLNNEGGHLLNRTIMGYSNTNEAFNYKILKGNFTRIGEYNPLIICNATSIGGFVSYNFHLTGTGFDFDEPRAIMIIGFLFILVFLFLVNIGGITMLPSKNDRNEKGELISINNLKYFRSILIGTSYLLLLSIVFISSNLAPAYFGTSLLGDLFFVIFQIMLILLLPMFVIWFLFILVSIFRDVELKKMLGRGVY